MVKQKDTNLGQECEYNVLQIKQGDLNFDRREQIIAALERVTVEKVNALFTEVFFKNPRRLNLKVHSHAHRDDAATRLTSQDLNKAFYSDIESSQGSTLTHTQIDDIAEFRRAHSLYPRI